MLEHWNERYRKDEFAYGTKPNTFFAEEISKLNPTTILLPMDGEGRNSVYCAKNGWHVMAFDYSVEGQKKALKLAKENSVNIDFHVCDVKDFEPIREVNVVGLTYTHLPSDLKTSLIQKSYTSLSDHGILIMEVYSEKQLGNTSGGPKSLDLLYTLDELDSLLDQFSEVNIWEEEVELDEGVYHQGKANVIRVLAKK